MSKFLKNITILAYIKYKIYKNTGSAGVKDKFYARAYHDETIDIEGLAEHISNHNTVYSKGTIHGVLMDMVGCIRELLLDSKKVKLDNLAIFSLGLSSRPADSPSDFSASTNIVKAYINALGTGEISKKQLDINARFKEVAEYSRGEASNTDTPSDPSGNPDGGTDNPNGGTGGSDQGGGSGDQGDGDVSLG